MKLKITMIDGSEVDWTTDTFMSLGDRVGFERRFGQSSAVLEKFTHLVDEDGKPKEGADFGELREEWVAFFVWRALRRAKPELATDDFDAFLETLATIGFDAGLQVVDPATEDEDDGREETERRPLAQVVPRG